MEPDPTLIVVTARAENAEEVDLALQTLVSVTSTAPGSMILVVDDRSPTAQAQLLEAAASELDCAYVLQQDGEGTSAAYNVGMTAAAEHGMDCCLVSAGITFRSTGWLEQLRRRTGTDGRLAAVVGGAIVNPDDTIRQAGFFFSLFRRNWSARLRNVPEILLDVDDPRACPVGSEVQLIRLSLVESVGLYDDEMSGSAAALDFCLRALADGHECIMQPTVRGYGLLDLDDEPPYNAPDVLRLRYKHRGMSFQPWSPVVV